MAHDTVARDSLYSCQQIRREENLEYKFWKGETTPYKFELLYLYISYMVSFFLLKMEVVLLIAICITKV